MQQPPAAASDQPKRSLRFRILQRDDFTCQYCGAKAPEVRLEVDHIVPRSKGGRNRADNLITACFDCNQGKKARELSPEQVTRFSKPVIAPEPVKRVVKPVRRRYVKKQSERIEDVALCMNCDAPLGDEWPCPTCQQETGSYSAAMLTWQLSDEDRNAYSEWRMVSANNRAVGRCSCIRPAEVMGTMCDACLHDLADAAHERSEWRRKEKEGCDCYDCDWCAEMYLDCANCYEAERVSGYRYCAPCYQDVYGEPLEVDVV